MAALDVENDMIKIEITLSTNRLNAHRGCDDQFDPQDYAGKLTEHLRPKLEDVVVRTTAFGYDHDIDIIVPEMRRPSGHDRHAGPPHRGGGAGFSRQGARSGDAAAAAPVLSGGVKA
jgi:hypothetical protein